MIIRLLNSVLLSAKSLNRSLKSELTNIDALHFARMQNQFPGRVKARLSRLGLPEFQIEGAVQVFDPTSAFDKVSSHSRL